MGAFSDILDDQGLLPFTVKANDDGALKNPRLELFAIMLASGFTRSEAWRESGKSMGMKSVDKESGSSRDYSVKVTKDSVFKGRVSTLEIERARDLADEPFGEARQAARTLYRVALAKLDVGLMKEGAKMMFDIAKADQELKKITQAPVEAGEEPVAGRPGRKSVQNPSNALDFNKIRRELAEKGVKTPDKAQEIEEIVSEEAPADGFDEA